MDYRKLLKGVISGDKAMIKMAKALFIGRCACCNGEFEKFRPDHKFCCKDCRQAYFYNRKMEAKK